MRIKAKTPKKDLEYEILAHARKSEQRIFFDNLCENFLATYFIEKVKKEFLTEDELIKYLADVYSDFKRFFEEGKKENGVVKQRVTDRKPRKRPGNKASK